jgi:L-fuconolactonase
VKEEEMALTRENWLSLTREEAIEPDLPICDAHHHLWYHAESSYPIEDFIRDISAGHNIVRTVFLESWKSFWTADSRRMTPVAETEYIENIVSKCARPEVAAGIVGFADLTSGKAVEPVLESHLAAGKGRFRGVRHTTVWDASSEFRSVGKGLLLDSNFRWGFACLRKYGLSFDAWLYHPQLSELADLAKSFPETAIIVNHVGGPLAIGPYARDRNEAFNDWKHQIGKLAIYHNVIIKLGGLGMDICGFGWHERPEPPGSTELAGAMSPYFLWCIEKFGVSRCMFESNFPVDKRSYSYSVIWNAFKKIIKSFSPTEKKALLHDTAAKVYRLVLTTL